MIKFFTYQFEMGKYAGYKLLSEKGVFASFKKIEYHGFKILYETSEFIHYQIDIQVIRKLKLKKLDNNIKRNSIEDRLSQLLDRSEEKEETEFKENLRYASGYFNYFNYNRNDIDLAQNINNELLEKRARNKYHANKYKHRI